MSLVAALAASIAVGAWAGFRLADATAHQDMSVDEPGFGFCHCPNGELDEDR